LFVGESPPCNWDELDAKETPLTLALERGLVSK
jgi:hypothetical protein